MPMVASFVDDMREAFGVELVNEWMRGRGGGSFCMRENGVRWCTPGRTCERCRREGGGS
jgi:hypothetical protein